MIPADIKFDANATPPQWTDDGEQVIEKGTNIRIKIKGLRSEVDKMYAVGTMKEVRASRLNVIDRWLSRISGLSWPVAVLVKHCNIPACVPNPPTPSTALHLQSTSDSDRLSQHTWNAAP
jgi:hypothetical protein